MNGFLVILFWCWQQENSTATQILVRMKTKTLKLHNWLPLCEAYNTAWSKKKTRLQYWVDWNWSQWYFLDEPQKTFGFVMILLYLYTLIQPCNRSQWCFLTPNGSNEVMTFFFLWDQYQLCFSADSRINPMMLLVESEIDSNGVFC